MAFLAPIAGALGGAASGAAGAIGSGLGAAGSALASGASTLGSSIASGVKALGSGAGSSGGGLASAASVPPPPGPTPKSPGPIALPGTETGKQKLANIAGTKAAPLNISKAPSILDLASLDKQLIRGQGLPTVGSKNLNPGFGESLLGGLRQGSGLKSGFAEGSNPNRFASVLGLLAADRLRRTKAGRGAQRGLDLRGLRLNL